MLRKLMVGAVVMAAACMLAPDASAQQRAFLFVGEGQHATAVPADGSWLSVGKVGPIINPAGARCVVTASWTGINGSNVYDVSIGMSENVKGPWMQRYEAMTTMASGAITNSFTTSGSPVTFYVTARNYTGSTSWNFELTRISAVCARAPEAGIAGEDESVPVIPPDGDTVN
jgi:hypothetical protein